MVIQRVWRSSASASSVAATPPAPSSAVASHATATGGASTAGATTTTTATTTTATTAAATSASDALHSTGSNLSINAHQETESTNSALLTRQKLKNALSGEATLEALKQRYSSGRSFMSQTANDAAIKSLELLRANIQCYFDREVDAVVKKFHHTYFLPAIRNIKENLGDGAISEEALKSVFCSLLENTKTQYGSQLSSPAGNSLSRANTPGMELSDSDSSTENTPATGVATSLLHQALKRKLPEPNQPDLFKRQYFLHGPIYPHVQYQSLPAQAASGGSSSGTTTSSSSASSAAAISSTRPTPLLALPTTTITPESLFILDFKVARALGTPDLRERLANKHPEVLRYCPDAQDRDWLLQQKQVTPLNKNGRYFLLALDDVKRLIERNAFEQSSSTLAAHSKSIDLQGFRVTELIYAKVQKLLKELTDRQQRATDGPFESPKTATLAVRPRFSSLSSSHATLTALLSTPHSQQTTDTPPVSGSSTSSSSTSSATSTVATTDMGSDSRRS